MQHSRIPRRVAVSLGLLMLLTLSDVGLIAANAFKAQGEAAGAAGEGLSAAPTADSSLARIDAPRGSKVLVFGDSWTEGLVANPRTDGFAYLTGKAEGWATTVDGVAGTGYLNPGTDRSNPQTYPDRIPKLPPSIRPRLVLLEGGINDAAVNYRALGPAAMQTYTAMRKRFPDSMVVVIGPGQTTVPANPDLRRVDAILAATAQAAHLHYISPIEESWFTSATYPRAIDTTQDDHPTNYGHALFAARLESDLHRIGAPAP